MSTVNYNFNIPAVGGDADGWGTLLNNNWTTLDSILAGDGSAIVIDGTTQDDLTLTGIAEATFAGPITENVHDAGASGAVEIDPANGTVQTINMTGNVTLTESMVSGQLITLRITSVNANSVTWPTMQWMFGVEPVLDTTRANWVMLMKVGTTLYGSYLGFSA